MPGWHSSSCGTRSRRASPIFPRLPIFTFEESCIVFQSGCGECLVGVSPRLVAGEHVLIEDACAPGRVDPFLTHGFGGGFVSGGDEPRHRMLGPSVELVLAGRDAGVGLGEGHAGSLQMNEPRRKNLCRTTSLSKRRSLSH